MCTEGMARAFRGSYPAIGLLTTAACMYAVASCPPLHAEVFIVAARPVNGTLRAVRCDAHAQVTTEEGSLVPSCALEVDAVNRLRVTAHGLSMGMPFLLCSALGAIFCVLTGKEAREDGGSLLSMDTMYVPDSYTPMGGHGGGGAGGGSLYTWELVFWGYMLCVHSVLLVALASPVDVFDTTVVVSFVVLCTAFLCKPRPDHHQGGGGAGGGGTQAIVLCVLVLAAWLALASIPHAYEADRVWLFVCLLLLDCLLLLVHMYDAVPSMYTIVMGRLTFVTLMNALLAYAFATLKDRLSSYAGVAGTALEEYGWTRLGEVCLGLSYAIALLGVYIHVLSQSPLRVGVPCPA